jgi:hypothetical protein
MLAMVQTLLSDEIMHACVLTWHVTSQSKGVQTGMCTLSCWQQTFIQLHSLQCKV